MEALDRFHPIKEDSLSQRHYFQSLVEQGRACGLLSEGDCAALQSALLLLLARQADQWTRGESSSIPTEKAQELLASILFVLGLALKTAETPEQAVRQLKAEPLEGLYDKGLKRLRRKMALARQLQKGILAQLLDTPNVYFRSTIADGIDGFFRLYQPQFAAQEIHITADYPLLLGRPELAGIEFIEEYLRRVGAENAFCRCFEPQAIHHLLCGLTPEYRSVPLNLFEPLLLSALGLVICGKNPKPLDLTEQDLAFLYQVFSGKSESELRERLEQALLRLQQSRAFPQGSLDYAALCIPKLALTIQNALKTKTLDKVFLLPAFPEREAQLLLSYGDRMSDSAYAKLLARLLQTEDRAEKARLLLGEVQSLADFLDIVADAALDAEDFERLINLLPLPALAILLSYYPSDDFLERESEQLLYQALQKRRSQLPPETQQQLEQMRKAIQGG